MMNNKKLLTVIAMSPAGAVVESGKGELFSSTWNVYAGAANIGELSFSLMTMIFTVAVPVNR